MLTQPQTRSRPAALLTALAIAVACAWSAVLAVPAAHAHPALASPGGGALAEATAAQAALSGAVAERDRLRSARQALVEGHERLGEQISALKARRGARLLPGGEAARLEALLAEAGVVAERLERMDRDVAASEAEVQVRAAFYRQAVDVVLAEARAALVAAAPQERAERFERVRLWVARRAEAEAHLRAPATASAPAALPTARELDGASPDELRELADEAEDQAERVRADLATLDAHLERLRARRRLLRAALAAQRDDALFGEDERNRRLVAGERPQPAVGGGARTPTSPGDDQLAEAGGGPSPVRGVDDGPGVAPPAAGGPARGGADAPEADSEGVGGDADFSGPGGAADPALEPDLAPPSAEPSAPLDPGGVGEGAGLTIEGQFDPELLIGDGAALSPSGLTSQIERVEARRQRLDQRADELSRRKAELEARARALEGD